jgi:DNA-binding NtrC family response regulator
VSYGGAVEGFVAAAGGSLCVLRRQLPRDFSAAVTMFRESDARVQLMICGGRRDKSLALLEVLAPILIPSLQERAAELPRIVEEFAADAAAALSSNVSLSAKDHDWICKHSASSLDEIETTTLRLVALRQEGNVLRASRLLGISHVSLGQWFQRRYLTVTPTTRRGPSRNALHQGGAV